MKVKKIGEYSPGYPDKKSAALKLGAIASAALLAVGSAACRPRISGDMEYVEPSEYISESAGPDASEGQGASFPVPTEPAADDPVLMGEVIADPGDGD